MKYVIKTIIIGLVIWMSVTLSSRAELPKVYQAVPGIHNIEEITTMNVAGYWNKLGALQKLIDTFWEHGPQVAEAMFIQFRNLGYFDEVNDGFIPVHNCFHYNGFTVCEINR